MSRPRGRARRADRLIPPGVRSTLSIGLVTAVLAFFAVLALAVGLAAGRLAEDWTGELAATATLQIVAAEDEVEVQARAALDVLRTTEGIRSVRVIELEEQRALLEPWLGAGLPVDSLPMPLLIEVATERGRLDSEALARRLAAEAPGAAFDDHAAWRRPLVATAERLRVFAFGCLALTALALAALFGQAARAAVAANGAVVETLRLVGARDGFIAGAVTRRLTRTAFGGALAGTGLGTVLVALLPRGSEQGFFLIGVGWAGWDWAAPLLVPLAAASLAWAFTRVAARRSLRRWS